MQSNDEIELIPVGEYAKRFCVSRTTIFEWKKNGILIPGRHYIKICRTLRFIWYSEVISEIHENNSRNIESKEFPSIKSSMPKKVSHKKSAINMEY